MTKEIEGRNKNEENLNRSMKENFVECRRLDCEISQLKLDLQESKHNEEELEKKIVILRNELVTANEYKEKFKVSLAKLDVLLKSLKKVDDKKSLGFEKGESFKFLKAILSQEIRRTNLKGHQQDILILKGIHISMVINLFAINLVI